MKLRILHVNDSLGRGGREKMVLQLCNGVNRENFDVAFLSLSNKMELIDGMKNDVKIYSLNYEDGKLGGVNLLLRSLSIIGKLKKHLKEIAPNVIHVHSAFFLFLLITIAIRFSFCKVKVVRTIHTGGLFYSSKSLIDRFRVAVERFAIKLNPTYLIAISEQIVINNQRLFRKQAKGLIKIYNGIDLSLFDSVKLKNIRKQWGCKDEDILGVYVARFDDGKNQKWLVELWESLKKLGYQNIKLVLVGDGCNFREVKNLIEIKELEGNILCLGGLDYIPDVLNSCDFGLFPSDFEGFSVGLIEKMAAGLPVITSAIPPFREVISSGENGFVINICDKDKWLKTIIDLATNKVLREKIGENARQRSLDFSIKQTVLLHEQLYKKIITE